MFRPYSLAHLEYAKTAFRRWMLRFKNVGVAAGALRKARASTRAGRRKLRIHLTSYWAEFWYRTKLKRIDSTTEPPKSTMEINTSCRVFHARIPQSPVWLRNRSMPNTRRNRGLFSASARAWAASLRLREKNGGEGGIRTHGTLACTPDFESVYV